MCACAIDTSQSCVIVKQGKFIETSHATTYLLLATRGKLAQFSFSMTNLEERPVFYEFCSVCISSAFASKK